MFRVAVVDVLLNCVLTTLLLCSLNQPLEKCKCLVLQLHLEPRLILSSYCTANTELHGDQEKFLGGYLYTRARECRPHTPYRYVSADTAETKKSIWKCFLKASKPFPFALCRKKLRNLNLHRFWGSSMLNFLTVKVGCTVLIFDYFCLFSLEDSIMTFWNWILL